MITTNCLQLAGEMHDKIIALPRQYMKIRMVMDKKTIFVYMQFLLHYMKYAYF